MAYVIQPAPIPIVPVHGGGQFPVRRIYCVGRNYVEHAQEMGHSGREPPFFFTKPGDTVVPVAEGETGRIALPEPDQELPSRDRTRGGARQGRARHPCQRCR